MEKSNEEQCYEESIGTDKAGNKETKANGENKEKQAMDVDNETEDEDAEMEEDKETTREDPTGETQARSNSTGGRGGHRQGGPGRGRGSGRGTRIANQTETDGATEESETETASNENQNNDDEDEEYDGDPDSLDFGSFAKRQEARKGHQNTNNRKNNAPTKSITDESNRVLKALALKEEILKKESRFGILFNRVDTQSKVTLSSAKLQELGHIIATMDPSAIILPHNNSETRAMPIREFAETSAMNFTNFFDSHVTKWGHQREDKFRWVASFYLASDAFSPNLKQLRDNNDMSDFLNENGLSMAQHALLESRDEAIGFLLGKSQQFTWAGDVQKRFKDHMRKHMKKEVEVAFKHRTVKVDDVQANVITLFVGKQDSTLVESCLTRNPFPGIDLIMYSLKRKGKNSYKNQLQLHNVLVNDSKAIKLCNIDESTEAKLRKACDEDSEARRTIIDFAKYKSSGKDQVLYVQCQASCKTWVTEWLTIQLQGIQTTSRVKPSIDANSTSSSPSQNRQHQNQISYQSRFNHILKDGSFSPSDSKSTKSAPTRWVIPPAIAVSKVSYSSVARGSGYAGYGSYGGYNKSTSSDQSDQSSVSSPDKSTTSSMKTKREIELEEIVEELSKKNEALNRTNKDLENKLSQFEAKTAAHITQLEATTAAQKKDLETVRNEFGMKFAKMEELLNYQFTESPNEDEQNPSSSPNGDRKRRNVHDTPVKMKLNRELRSLQIRQGDIWQSDTHQEEAADSGSIPSQTLPAEVSPHNAGTSANTK